MPLDAVIARIRAAERAHGRPPGAVTLIAVSKQQPAPRIRATLDGGWRVFGENYVQEAARRWADTRGELSDLRLHLVGPLQSNKARRAVGLFDAIHTLDRPSLARRLARLGDELGALPDLFIQVNTADEPQKSGVAREDADAFIRDCRAMGLSPVGLMCIPPHGADAGPHFTLLHSMAERHGLPMLSMGMSADFELAIRHGATHVRVGSAIFGARPA